MRLSKIHFDVLIASFEREERRMTELIERGKIFLTILTIYTGVLTLKVSEVGIIVKGDSVSVFFVSAAAVSAIIALLLTLLSLGIFTYEEPWAIEEAAIDATDHATIDDFYEDRIADLGVAAERNSNANDKRARLLFYSSSFLIITISCHLIAFITYVTRTQ